jgi:hypothetical protein
MRKLLQGSIVAFATVAFATLALPTVGMAEGTLAKTPATKVQIDIKGKPGAPSTDKVDIETGKYYNLIITSDGGDEVSITAPEFVNNIWLNQITVADAEIRMWGSSFKVLEVGQTAPNHVEITFVAIKPGDYPFSLNGKPGGTFHVH